MNRLRHSPDAYVRMMQMSAATVFAFVEGKGADRFFYGQICKRECEGRSLMYRIATASETPSNTGGKQSLLEFFRYLEANGHLDSNFKGKRTITIFYLDKDIDDLLGQQVQSSHVIYTPTYDVEGKIFEVGDLVRALAASASLDESEVAKEIKDANAWRRSCAERWRDWITLSIFTKKYRIRSCPGYRVASEVNDKSTGNLDHAKKAAYLQRARNASGLSQHEFDRKLREVEELVSTHFASARHGEIFKGKWYVQFISYAALAIANGRDIDLHGIHAGMIGALSSTVDFNGQWASDFRRPLAELLN
jgi:hypothetical protein